MLGKVEKQPADVLDYDIDFSEWLPDGDTVVSAVVTADAGITVVSNQVLSPVVKVWLSGGTDGETYKVTITMTTDEGRVKQEEFRVRVRET